MTSAWHGRMSAEAHARGCRKRSSLAPQDVVKRLKSVGRKALTNAVATTATVTSQGETEADEGGSVTFEELDSATNEALYAARAMAHVAASSLGGQHGGSALKEDAWKRLRHVHEVLKQVC